MRNKMIEELFELEKENSIKVSDEDIEEALDRTYQEEEIKVRLSS